MGLLYKQQGHLEEARKLLEAAIALRPDTLLAKSYLSHIYAVSACTTMTAASLTVCRFDRQDEAVQLCYAVVELDNATTPLERMERRRQAGILMTVIDRKSEQSRRDLLQANLEAV